MFKVIVDKHSIILHFPRKFHLGRFHALSDAFLGFRPPPAKPFFKNLERGRLYEDQVGRRHFFADLEGALNIYLQNNLPALGDAFFHGLTRRPVVRAMDARPFKKFTIGYHAFEFRIRYEEVIDAFFFATSRLPCRSRNRQTYIGILSQ